VEFNAPWQIKIISEKTVDVELATQADAGKLAELLRSESIPFAVKGNTVHVESFWGDVFDVLRGNRMFAAYENDATVGKPGNIRFFACKAKPRFSNCTPSRDPGEGPDSLVSICISPAVEMQNLEETPIPLVYFL